MVEIFRRRGGHEFASLAERLTPDQIAHIDKIAGAEAIIAMRSSENEWFAVTSSHFVVKRAHELHRVPFDDICAVTISQRYPRDVRKFEHIKTKGGDMDVELQDGNRLRLTVEPGGPYIGLMNVLMRIATINRRRGANGIVRPGVRRPTVNSQ